MLSPLEKSKKLTGSCNKRSSSPSSPVTADTDTVTTSSKKSKVEGLFSSEDDDSNKNQQQIIINKLEDENKALKIKNKTLEAAAGSSTVATAATATVLTSTESSTILAPFVASVLRDQTLADLLQEVQQLNGLLQDRNNQIVTHEATQYLEKIRLRDSIANIRDNARYVVAVGEALRQFMVEHPLYQEVVENYHNLFMEL